MSADLAEADAARAGPAGASGGPAGASGGTAGVSGGSAGASGGSGEASSHQRAFAGRLMRYPSREGAFKCGCQSGCFVLPASQRLSTFARLMLSQSTGTLSFFER